MSRNCRAVHLGTLTPLISESTRRSAGICKKEDDGIHERVAVLRKHLPDLSVEGLQSKAKELKCKFDDIVDATCLAVTASLAASGQCETIPACPEQDERGLYMRLTVPKKLALTTEKEKQQ